MWGKSKYHAKKTVVDGITFDSKREAEYYLQLKDMQSKGLIKGFERQVAYELQPTFKYRGETVRSIKYVADFVIVFADGHEEVWDTKGFRTDTFKLKAKMLKYKYPDIIFKEVR